jgi:hypothetical protein
MHGMYNILIEYFYYIKKDVHFWCEKIGYKMGRGWIGILIFNYFPRY